MELQNFNRKSFPVSAVQVTEANIAEVATWCRGRLITIPVSGERYIKVDVTKPQDERQTEAHYSDYVVDAGRGFKVYTEKAFKRTFEPNNPDPEEAIHNVFDAARLDTGSSTEANAGGTFS